MPFLTKAREFLSPAGIFVGAQDISEWNSGAHTGYVGGRQLVGLCSYAIVGHSERGEPRESVERKVEVSLNSGIQPIVCFKSPSDFAAYKSSIYALEDPANISKGGVYSPKPISNVTELVKEARAFFGSGAPIIYGGSVTSETAGELAGVSGLDGVLVGNASLNPIEFAGIVEKFIL